MRTLVTLLLLAAPLRAQSDDKPTPIKNPAVVVPGYTAYKIQGFTAYVSADTLAVPAKDYERPPLAVLDGELSRIVAVMNPRSVIALRRLIIWVEWEEVRMAEPGRGTAVAVYRSGSPQAMLANDLHPLKSKTVDVVNMKALTEEHQPKRDSGRCVLMHEFAHAVHDQLIGYADPTVKAAFAQAMERRLYDKGQYATTNAAEFFAELTCSYLDRLDYFPATREDLQKHDPTTFKLMQKVWGSGLRKPPPPPKAGGDAGLKLADLRFGNAIVGPELAPASFAGNVVLIVWYGGNQANALDRAEKLRAELGDYGLTVVGAHYSSRTPEATVRGEAAKRGSECRIAQGVFVPRGDGSKLYNQEPPLAMLFAPDGANVHKGPIFAADKAVRAAVGAKLLADATAGGDTPDEFKTVADAFKQGASPVAALPKLAAALKSGDANTKAAAERLRDAILKPLVADTGAALKLEKSDPAAAFVIAERVAEEGKGTPEGAKAAQLVNQLKRTPAVATELRARAALEPIAKLAGRLRGQDGSFDPQSARFQARNAAAIAQLQQLAAQFRTKYAGAKAVADLEREVGEFGG